MHSARHPLTIMRGLVKRYGPSKLKMRLWDQEFSGKHWDFIDDTMNDCIYPYLERYSKSGAVLDLGCGPGNTANELNANIYTSYVGVDISEAALAKAKRRTKDNGRENKNSFVLSDFMSYQPAQRFDLILFRESMYHIPLNKVGLILARFSQFLKEDGVFIVRMNITDGSGGLKPRLAAAIDVIEAGYDVVEKRQHGQSGPTVVVFRPRSTKPMKEK